MHETVQIKRLQEMAARRGWSWTPEPSSGFCGRLQIGDDVRFVIGADVGVNSAGAARIARDKAFAQFFLDRAGLPTVPTRVLHSTADVESIIEFPVLLKPNEGHGGAGVSIATVSEELFPAYELARKISHLVLAQPVIQQREFRIVVFNRRPLLAYEKRPLILTSDGKHSIRALLPPPFPADPRVAIRLRQYKLDLDSVLAAGETFQPFPVANLKSGGTWRECLSELSPALLAGSVGAAKSLGLIMAGVDLFAPAPRAETFVINEVNASPGLEMLAEETAMLDPLFSELEGYLGNSNPRH